VIYKLLHDEVIRQARTCGHLDGRDSVAGCIEEDAFGGISHELPIAVSANMPIRVDTTNHFTGLPLKHSPTDDVIVGGDAI
jgi:hypothetical protein